MVRESLAKKSLQPSLDGKTLRTLVMELDEQKQESISGGAKRQSSTYTPEGEIAWSIGFADVVRP
jgi:hypothetical protein